MIIAKIIGPVVSTIKHKSFANRRIFAVQPVDANGKPNASSMLTFDDYIRPGPGDTVLVCREGGSCRLIWNDSLAPVNSVIVGVIDDIHKS